MKKESRAHEFLTWFERAIIAGLIILMGVTVLFSALDLVVLLVRELLAPPCFFMDVNKLLDTFLRGEGDKGTGGQGDRGIGKQEEGKQDRGMVAGVRRVNRACGLG